MLGFAGDVAVNTDFAGALEVKSAFDLISAEIALGQSLASARSEAEESKRTI